MDKTIAIQTEPSLPDPSDTLESEAPYRRLKGSLNVFSAKGDGEGGLVLRVADGDTIIEVLARAHEARILQQDERAAAWEDAVATFKRKGWLEKHYARYGSLQAIETALGMPSGISKAMLSYVNNVLNWRISYGVELKRYHFLRHYFAENDPDKRPSVTELAERANVTPQSAYRWIKDASEGQFFSRTFEQRQWDEIQRADELGLILFPGGVGKPADPTFFS